MNRPILLSATGIWAVMAGLYWLNRYLLRTHVYRRWMHMSRQWADSTSMIVVLLVNCVLLTWYFLNKKRRHDRSVRRLQLLQQQQQEQRRVANHVTNGSVGAGGDIAGSDDQHDDQHDGDDNALLLLPLDYKYLLDARWFNMRTMVFVGLWWVLLSVVHHFVSHALIDPLVLEVNANLFDRLVKQYMFHTGQLWVLVLLSQLLFPILIGRLILSMSEKVDNLEALPDREVPSPMTPQPGANMHFAYGREEKLRQRQMK